MSKLYPWIVLITIGSVFTFVGMYLGERRIGSMLSEGKIGVICK